MTLQEILIKQDAGTLAKESTKTLQDVQQILTAFSTALKKHDNSNFRLSVATRAIPTQTLDRISDSISTILQARSGCND